MPRQLPASKSYQNSLFWDLPEYLLLRLLFFTSTYFEIPMLAFQFFKLVKCRLHFQTIAFGSQQFSHSYFVTPPTCLILNQYTVSK